MRNDDNILVKEETIKVVCLVLNVMEKVMKNGEICTEFLLTDGKNNRIAWMVKKQLDYTNSSMIYKNKLVEVTLELLSEYSNCLFIKEIKLYTNGKISVEEYASHCNKEFLNILLAICKHTAYTKEEKEPIANLTFKILNKYKDLYVDSVAGKSIHHCEEGGLLTHSANMVVAAQKVCELYEADEELLICGAALHDIGKLFEMQTINGITSYTTLGRLLGHTALGVMLIHYESRGGNYDKERLTLLEHMVAAHHGCKNYGAIVEPATKEALILHKLDGLDAKVDSFKRIYLDLEEGSMSSYIKGLGTSVYKPFSSN